jgi:hypothetical protein
MVKICLETLLNNEIQMHFPSNDLKYLLYMCSPWGKNQSLNLNMFDLSNMKKKIHVKVWICQTI